MYIHLGNNAVLKTGDIIGVFDLDNTTVSARTRSFLAKAEKRGDIVLTSGELPKSFILAGQRGQDTKVYISQLSPATLAKRKKI